MYPYNDFLYLNGRKDFFQEVEVNGGPIKMAMNGIELSEKSSQADYFAKIFIFAHPWHERAMKDVSLFEKELQRLEKQMLEGVEAYNKARNNPDKRETKKALGIVNGALKFHWGIWCELNI